MRTRTSVSLVTLGLLGTPTFALAATISDLTQLASPGDLVAWIYTYAQTVIGLCIFGMFLYAGLRLIILGDRKGAQQIAVDAVVALALLFAAYVILNSINHDLVEQQSSAGVGANAGGGSGGAPTPTPFQGGGGRSGGGGASGAW